MYGRMTRALTEALGEIVKGKRVLEIGAGDLDRSLLCLDLGATRVIAVDPHASPHYARGRKNLKVHDTYLSMVKDLVLQEKPEVVLLAWPVQYNIDGLGEFLHLPVVYIGCSTDFTACGSPGLWHHFRCREVLKYVPDERNTLIHYGDILPTMRDVGGLYHAEIASLSARGLDYCDYPRPVPHPTRGVLDPEHPKSCAQAMQDLRDAKLPWLKVPLQEPEPVE